MTRAYKKTEAPIWQMLRQVIKGTPLEGTLDSAEAFLSRASILGSGKLSDEFGMDPSLMETLRPFFQFLYHIYFRVEQTGVANIPAKGPAILVSNHSGVLPYDGVMIHLAVYNEHRAGRIVRFLVEDFVFNTPLLGGFISKAGGVRACHENATKLLKKHQLIVVFPEGTKGVGKSYDERYKVTRLGRGGFIKLAMRTGVPVIPVAVIGAEEIHPIIWKSKTLAAPLGIPFFPFTPTFPWLGPLGLVPLPSKWHIQFGRPISFKKYRASDAEDDELVEKNAERVRSIIQRMIDDGLKRRGSVWY